MPQEGFLGTKSMWRKNICGSGYLSSGEKKPWNEASQNKALDRLYWFAWPWYNTEPSPNSRHLITERHSSREQWSSHPRKLLDSIHYVWPPRPISSGDKEYSLFSYKLTEYFVSSVSRGGLSSGWGQPVLRSDGPVRLCTFIVTLFSILLAINSLADN